MRTSRIVWTLLGLTFVGFVTTAGDASAQDKAKQEEADEVEMLATDWQAPITLTVVNDNWADMKIYALKNGTRYRLGTVTSFQSERFVLPAHLQPSISEVQLLAVPIGGSRSVVSPVVYPYPGDEVVWGLQNNLALSGTTIG